MEQQQTQTTERVRELQGRTREVMNEATRMAGQFTSLAADSASVWSEASQEVLRQAMQLSSSAAQHGAQVLVEVQQANLHAMQDFQSSAWRWASMWPEALRDPIRWYQRACEEGTGAVYRSFEVARKNAETLTHSFERLQSATEETARSLEQTFKDATGRMQDVYSRAERLRAA